MRIKNALMALVLVTAFSCGKRSASSEIVDSAALEVAQDTLENTEDNRNFAQPVDGLQGVDTLFNHLARLQLLQGEFESAQIITNAFIDPATLSGDGLIAALVTTGEGEYNGGRENIQFATQHAVLAVFKQSDDGLTMLNSLDLGSSENFGLYACDISGEALMLSEERYGVLIHQTSYEEGAGDSGFRKDDVSLYVLLNNEITLAFETTIDDFQFSSDEQGSWYESTTTVELATPGEKTNGLFDLSTVSSTATNGSEPEEDEIAMVPENPTEPLSGGTATFKWNGEMYEQFSPNE